MSRPQTLSGPARKAAALIEDVEWLLSFRTPWVEIRRRLDRSPVALERCFRRHGRPDLANGLWRAFGRAGIGWAACARYAAHRRLPDDEATQLLRARPPVSMPLQRLLC